MLVVHHLSNSRSHRILWLLEELDVPYEIRFHERQAGSHAAPEALKDIHPLGKSPIVTEADRVVAESGAIVDYIVRRHGQGRLAPPSDSWRYDEYVQWPRSEARRVGKKCLITCRSRWSPDHSKAQNETENHSQ